MRKFISPLAIFATMFVAVLHAAPAQAQARVFVGAQGSDSNACTSFALPCRTLQHAHDTVAANGEIDVIDPAGYGVLSIAKAISIQGHGFASIAAPSGPGITILAGVTDKINLRGLLVDGVHTGTNGLVFNAGASLTLEDCVFRNFTTDGIFFNPGASSELSVSNTLVTDNGAFGIAVVPTGSGMAATGVADRVESNNNATGLIVTASLSTGTIKFTISNSVMANNGANGVSASSLSGQAATNVMVVASAIANNGSAGLVATGSAAILRFTRSTITGNATGLSAFTGGTLSSYGDNNLDGNTTNGTPTNVIGLH